MKYLSSIWYAQGRLCKFTAFSLLGSLAFTLPTVHAQTNSRSLTIEAEAYTNQFGVRSEPTTDTNGGANIGYINNGDYSEYQINVPDSGTYVIEARVASRANGGRINLLVNEASIGALDVSSTGGWQNWASVNTSVQLDAGRQTLRLAYSGGGGNLFNVNRFSLSLNDDNTPAVVAIPGTIQAENFIRQSGVENERTSDVNGQQNVAYIHNGDFTEYRIDVPETGTYVVNARVASGSSGGTITYRSNNANVGSVRVGGTGGWQNWQTVSSNVQLNAGSQILQLAYSGGDGYLMNINWLSVEQGDTVVTNGFIHPAVGFSVADLDRMKANRTIEPWATGWQGILETEGSLNYQMQGPFEEVGNQPGINQRQHIADSEAVLFHAIQWYFTRNEAHARKAVDILDAWATTHRTWSGRSVHLHAAWRGGNYVMGAEILRHTYPGWTEENTRNTETYFRNILYPQFRRPNPLRAANQGANNLMGAMFVAAYLSDQGMWDDAIDAYLNDPCAGITNSLPNGQAGDSGRDQGHAMAQLGNLAMAAEIAWKQGIDLYGALDNRLLNMHEYWAKYNSGESVPFIDHGTCYGYYTEVGSSGRTSTVVHSAALNELVYGAFNIRKGLQSRYGQSLHDNGVNGNRDSEILTFLHRKDLTDTSVATPREPERPIPLRNASNLVSVDIGDVGLSGNSSFNNNNWTLNGSGTGIGTRFDGFQYAYKELRGDGAMVARVTSITGDGRACITIRDSLDQFTDMARVCATPDDGVQSSDIGKIAADGSGSQTFPLAQLPIWLKLERRGDEIHTFVGPDGVSWASMTNLVMDIPADYFIGLAVTSQDNSRRSVGTFTNVRVSD